MTRPESAHLTVAQIRQKIYEEVRGQASPSPSAAQWGALTGGIFHRVVFGLMALNSPVSWMRSFGREEIADSERIIRHAYERLLGPELVRHRGKLDGAGQEALVLWNATQAFCRWLSGLLSEALRNGLIAYDPSREEWSRAEELFESERKVSTRFKDPGWRAPVVVTGRADMVVHFPGRRRWCVVELKLGAGCPEADAAQACLYDALLGPEQTHEGGSVALLRFGETAEEHVFSGDEFERAKAELRGLIGRMAGVSVGSQVAPPPVVGSGQWPRPPSPRDQVVAERLRAAFDEFGTPVRLVGQPLVGPAFVRFFVEPERRVRVKQVLCQGLNLQARLHTARQPLIHVEKGRIAVDVAREDRESVSFSQVVGSLPQNVAGGNPKILVGIDLEGKPKFADLSDPLDAHILVGGTSGSGKSEWLRSAIASLVLTNTPGSLRLALIDPKRNAFAHMKDSPFLMEEIGLLHPPEDDVIAALEALVSEMERRYQLFEEAGGCADLAAYARKSGASPPRIVCICDEYADLILSGRKVREEVERMVGRLGQKARAAGIHLVLATQRPSRTVVTGVIKANMPCRVALRVTDWIESKMVLGYGGAENLLGCGDLLFADIGEPVRLQSPYVAEGRTWPRRTGQNQ